LYDFQSVRSTYTNIILKNLEEKRLPWTTKQREENIMKCIKERRYEKMK
jgi:hypothetical protein